MTKKKIEELTIGDEIIIPTIKEKFKIFCKECGSPAFLADVIDEKPYIKCFNCGSIGTN